MRLLQLHYFIKVAELKNISHAAAYYMIPQSAMSKTISALEKELNLQLFTRIRNRLSLTPEGEYLYQHVRSGLLMIDQAVEDLKARNQSLPLYGNINLLILQHRYNLINCVSTFKKEYPNVNFSIAHRIKDCPDYDFCISSFAPDKNAQIIAPLVSENLLVALSKTHPLAKRESISFKDIKDENFLFLSPDSSLAQIVSQRCKQSGFSPVSATYVDDLLCIEKYVINQFGITVVPAVSWNHMFQHDCVLFQLSDQLFVRNTFLFGNSGRTKNPASKKFVDYFLREYPDMFSQLPAKNASKLSD